MGDLISRNALLNLLAAYGDSDRKTDYDNGWDDARDEIAREVKHAEAVDAEPVRHGQWISLEPEIGLFGCSLCEHMILRAECNYCPNCGARMDAKVT